MYKFKGFSIFPGLADNSPGTIAPFGELSPISKTFAKEQGQYYASANPDVVINSFLSLDDLDAPVTAPAVLSAHIVDLCQWIYDQYIADNMPVDAATLTTELTTAFTVGGSNYNADLTLTNITIGEVVAHPDTGNHPNKRMPDYIQWDLADAVSTDTFQIRIWFIDDRFQAQYDEYEIVVLPPLTPVDNLNDTLVNVSNALSAVSTADVLAAIETAKGGYPPTRVKNEMVVWHDPNNFNNTLNTNWTILIYGPAGDTYENIEAAIVQYLVDNSAQTQLFWQGVYPSLYAASEFYIIPMWDQIAIEEMINTDGIYSPLIQPSTIQALVDEFAFGYDPGQTPTTTVIGPSQYKGAAFLAVGNINNEGGLVRLDLMFEDYANLPTSSIDFNRMDPVTQGFISFLSQLLEHAEEATANTILPAGFSKSTRGTNLYVIGRYNDTDFIAITKTSYLAP